MNYQMEHSSSIIHLTVSVVSAWTVIDAAQNQNYITYYSHKWDFFKKEVEKTVFISNKLLNAF